MLSMLWIATFAIVGFITSIVGLIREVEKLPSGMQEKVHKNDIGALANQKDPLIVDLDVESNGNEKFNYHLD